MKSFEASAIKTLHVIRLDPGEDVLDSLELFITENDIKEGAVISGVATLNSAVLHMVTTTGYPPKEYFKQWNDEPLELLSLNGVIADYKPHLHVTLSDSKVAYGGHLEKGCTILYLGEFVLVEFVASQTLKRMPNHNGINTLV